MKIVFIQIRPNKLQEGNYSCPQNCCKITTYSLSAPLSLEPFLLSDFLPDYKLLVGVNIY